MTRPSLPLPSVFVVLCLLAQGALLYYTGRWAEAPHLLLLLLFCGLAVAAGAAALWSWRQGAGHRPQLWVLLTMELSLLLAAGASLSVGDEESEAWVAEGHRALAATVDRQEMLLVRLEAAVAEIALEATRHDSCGDPFDLLAGLSEQWTDRFPAADRYPLALTLWQDGERIAWDAHTLPWPLPSDAGGGDEAWRMLQGWSEGWYWRHFVPLRTAHTAPDLLELQVRLTDATEWLTTSHVGSWAGTATGEERVRCVATVLQEGRPNRDQWGGDAGRGLRLTRDLSLGKGTGRGEPFLRVTAWLPPQRVERDQAGARRLLLMIVFWSLAVIGWGWAAGGAAGLVAGLWAARLLLVGVDFFRWFQPAFPGQRLPALPTELSSLIDPAYFATPLAGGWFASSADALLTALVIAATAFLGVRLLSARPQEATSDKPFWWRLGVGFLLGLLTAAVLLLLRAYVFEIVQNANPRLIGQQVPFRFMTFWALHLVLLLVSGAAVGLLAFLIGRWRWYAAPRPSTLAALLGATVLALVQPGVAPLVRAVLLLAFLLLWWITPLARTRGVPLRRVYVAVPLLVTVLWNYTLLAEAYDRAERNWLVRKGEQIVQPQDEWIQFLMEDVLMEMATSDAATAATATELFLADDLWRNRAAYDLWRRSAIRDLGLPCLVEIIDEEGYTTSLFASGFLWDLGYEVRERSPWRTSSGLGVPEAEVTLQTEQRRYPTGAERLLRGEIARDGDRGWIRIELPVQSQRISTLLARLSGSQPQPGITSYHPRAEVDRPLLLLRGDKSGWLDAGPAGYPDDRSTPVVAALQEGRLRWGVVQVETQSYLCLWSELPPAAGGSEPAGFLLGLQRPGFGDRLLDLSRLMLVDLLLLGALGLLWQLVRLLRREPTVARLGFQERFLVGYLALGLLLLIMAGMSVDRLSLERIDRDARDQARNGLTAAMGQLKGMLAEQARALAESEYIADLLANRLAGRRPLGPFSVRQGMVFSADGELLLDETLSDLDANEAALLLAAAREAPLTVVVDESGLFFGVVIPIDLTDVLPESGERGADGFFFYRQRADGDLVTGLAEIVQGEVTLRVGGEAVLASHPERVFSRMTPLLAPPLMIRWLQEHPFHPYLYPTPGTRLSFTGCVALPTLVLAETGLPLRRLAVPAVLGVDFPARGREFAAQREQTVLYLAGLSSLILLAAVLLALLMAWNIFGPIRILVTATQRLAGGDFAAPLPEAGRDEVGTLAASFRVMRDKLCSAQDRLAERERFLTTVLNRVSVGVAVFDARGRIVAVNPAGETILGGFYDESDSDNTKRAALLLASFQEIAGSRSQAGGELHSSDGRRTLRGRLAPLTLPDGRRDTMIVFEDVTEFLNNKRLALNAELARQVAHEIKNPLTPIQLSIQHLWQAYRDQSPELDQIVSDTVERVLEQVRLLRSIATEFSLLGRPGELDCEPLDFQLLVRKVIARYQTADTDTAGTGVYVEISPVEVPLVLAHAESLVRVLGNLMENAIDACGGTDQLRLRIRWEVTETEVSLFWEDNGPGLTADVADRLFDPYFSTKSTGTGLGLAICRNLLDKMGGNISLTNRSDGPGAVAKLTLPQFFKDEAGADDE